MFSKLRLLVATIILSCFGLLIYLCFLPPSDFKVVFLNVGQGDAALIVLKTGVKILVDCGPDQKILRELSGRLDFFDRQIDYLLVTHPDADHYAGCLDVLRHYKVKNIFVNGTNKTDEPVFLSWQDFLSVEKANVFVVDRPTEYNLDGAKIKFYNPDPALSADKENDNDVSLVFKFFYNTTTVFFAADMEEDLENELLKKYCPGNTAFCPEFKSDYLKVGHHGSDSSSGKNFLAAVNAQQAVVSVGKNSYGHPSLRILKRLQRAGMKILRTDQEGDIIVR